MDQENHSVSKLHRHVKKYGTKGLLPQNLTDELLNRMNLEGDAINEDKTEEIPSSTLLMAILFLKNGSKTFNKMEIKIDPELLMDYFDLYLLALRIEDMRRKKIIFISDDSLPTIENLLDQDRELTVSGFN